MKIKYWMVMLLCALMTGACSDGELEGDLYPVSPDQGGEVDNSNVGNSQNINDLLESMVRIPGGTFLMGSEEFWEETDESPMHFVTLSGFYISQFEVPQRLWTEIMGSNPSVVKQIEVCYYNYDYPVTNVSYDDCLVFIHKLNERTGKVFALPTEAQWELAARDKYAESYSSDDVLAGNRSGSIERILNTYSSHWDLCQMGGNVWEWCADWYGEYSSENQEDPTGPKTGQYRVFRGGSFLTDRNKCRATYRASNLPSTKGDDLGFRLVMKGFMDLQVSQEKLDFKRNGGTQKITVTTEKSWSYNVSATWCRVSKSGKELTVTVEDNQRIIRRAVLTITAGDDVMEIPIEQDGEKIFVGKYYNQNGVRGIIYEISNDAKSGKIVSLQESLGIWGLDGNTYATSASDGESNMNIIGWTSSYPAFYSCYRQGTGWYLPAYQELRDLFSAVRTYGFTAFNDIIGNNGGTRFSSASDYWSSTEQDYEWAWTMNKEGVTRSNVRKDGSYRVRAIRKVTFD